MKSITGLLCFIALNQASAQSDDDYLQQARISFAVTHKCIEAHDLLSTVSPAAKTQAGYLYCMAKTYDCLQNADQAIRYYDQYIGIERGNDSAKKRLQELQDESARRKRIEPGTLYQRVAP